MPWAALGSRGMFLAGMEAARHEVFVIAARGMALSLGTFTVLNALGEGVSPGFDANEWWIDLRALPAARPELPRCSNAGVSG